MPTAGEVQREPSIFLFPADDSDISGRAFEWMLKSLYRDGDEVHLLHVIPRIKFQASYGVPAGELRAQTLRDGGSGTSWRADTAAATTQWTTCPTLIVTSMRH
jgi:nucleotide-binding universal stress UspA family protein